jgi:hypothetical protein
MLTELGGFAGQISEATAELKLGPGLIGSQTGLGAQRLRPSALPLSLELSSLVLT